MAITLRPTEEHDKKLDAFMAEQGHATKSKALLWLIDNAERLVESDKRLNAISEAYERQQRATEMLSDLLPR